MRGSRTLIVFRQNMDEPKTKKGIMSFDSFAISNLQNMRFQRHKI